MAYGHEPYTTRPDVIKRRGMLRHVEHALVPKLHLHHNR